MTGKREPICIRKFETFLKSTIYKDVGRVLENHGVVQYSMASKGRII